MGVLQELKDYIISADRLSDDGIPSASIAILDESGKPDATIIGNGAENIETVYQACSISKAITALGVAKLVDNGKLSYDTKVVDYIPDSIVRSIVDSRTAHLMHHVTVGMLLSHRSGLSQHGFPGFAADLPTVEQVFSGTKPANTPRIRFNAFPGAHHSYSGGGFTLLQIFLERMLDQPFAEFMRETVLEPLGMTRSRYGDLPSTEQNYARAHWTAQVEATDAPRGHWRFVELAAAGLWTTPTDLLKAVRAVQVSLEGSKGGEGAAAFLSKQTATSMLSAARPLDPSVNCAMGWFSDANFFGHAGDNSPGYCTYVVGSHGGVVNNSGSAQEATSKTHHGGPTVGKGALCIMTNSVLGHAAAIKPITAAIFYLQKWPLYPSLPGGFGSTMTNFVPYAAAHQSVVDDDKDEDGWVGTWGERWQILRHETHMAVMMSGVPTPMRLLPAAAPTAWADGRSHRVFVVDGLDMAVRLTEKDDEKSVEIVQDEVMGDPLVLKRT